MARGGFPGGMNMGNMNNLMKQAKNAGANAQDAGELEEKQWKPLSAERCAVITKRQEIWRYHSPEAVDPDDVEMLQDLIMAAVNEATRKADEMAQAEMGKLTGGMGMPGLF